MIPMDFGVFDLSVYAFITGVRKREEKSGYDTENFLSAPLPPATLRCEPLLGGYHRPLSWIFSGPEEEPEKNAQDVAYQI